MSRRVDLYPVALPRLAALFGAKGWEHGRAIIETMRAEGQGPDEQLADELLSGRLRASQPDAEDGALAALVSQLAYRLRDPDVPVLFDVGGVWNALDTIASSLTGEERRLARALLRGRPLVGAKIESDWDAYAWIQARELGTFSELLGHAARSEPASVAEIRDWMKPLSEKKLDVFVSIG